jgi:pyrimidine oxygenase
MPSGKIPVISAGQSEAGTRFAVEHADYNFRSGGGINRPTRVAESVGRLVTANKAAGTHAALSC